MALNQRYLNPQMGRILRTLGFDRMWVRGEGAHLIDSHGRRYLDLLGGYGVFAIGRNHPAVREAVEEAMEARTANLPQLGVTLLSGVLAEQLLARAPGSVEAMVPANSGTEAVEAAIKIARAATGRARVLYAEHAFHGLTLGALSLNGDEDLPRGLRAAAARLPRRALRRSRCAAARARTRRCGRVRRGARAGQGRQPAPAGLPAGRAASVPRGGDALRVRRGADGPRAHRALLRARALGPGTGHGVPRQGALRRDGADRRGARLARRLRRGLRRHGARGAPRLDLRRQRPRRGRRPGDSARARAARGWWIAPSGWEHCCWSSRARSWSATRSSATCAGWA